MGVHKERALNYLKPFHEAIVDAINEASRPREFRILAILIKRTRIPEGHDAIAKAWERRVLRLGLSDHLGVPVSVRAQKPALGGHK